MRILIIDDDIILINSLLHGLQEENFTIDSASDGERGSYLARTNSYDLIILDISMPKKSGEIVCEEIRRAKKNCPILILSASDEIDLKVKLLECGADDYLTKPFSFKELVARIRALVRRPKNIDTGIYIVSDLELNSFTQKVKRGKKIIYLTRKEFGLLEYMMKNEGKVLSRASIMEHVWNEDSDPFSNTIEAHIMNLRKKIRGGNQRKLIHNIPGRGYKIEEVDNKV